MFDALVIGGGASGLSCALVLGSALKMPYAKNKKVAIITHQKSSDLQAALFNNVLGLKAGTLGKDILQSGKQQLLDLYPQVLQINSEKVTEINEEKGIFTITTNKNTYQAKIVVIAVGYSSLLTINGLQTFIEPHPKSEAEKSRIWLKNTNHLIKEGLYVAGTLAGWRSQFAIACGSGAQVATDILTIWNGGKHTKVHDKMII